jgi:quinol monooxygenase YgiN
MSEQVGVHNWRACGPNPLRFFAPGTTYQLDERGPLKPMVGRRKVGLVRWRHRGATPDRKGWIVHARSTTVQARPSSIDAGIAHVRDQIMPALQAMDGCIGVSVLADRESGQCIITTAWQSEEAMRASTERASELRDRAKREFDGEVLNIDEWEIAVLHRDHRSLEGACVRATWVRIPADQVDGGIEFYKSRVLPDIEGLEGFCSASLLVDRASGRAVASSTYDSREAMERNRAQATALRDARGPEAGAEVLDECEFELALAHLRVPELV